MATETQFKQSNVGIIPTVWDVSSIGDQCQIFGRIGFRGYTKNDIVKENQGAITLSPSNIINGELNLEKVTFLSWFKYEESPEIKIYKGDILLVKTGSTYGKTTFIKDLNKKATLNPQIVVLKNIRCCNQWLGYVMKFNIIQNQIKATIVGGAIPTLSQEQVSNFQIPLPPLPEQEAIAEVLSDTDALIGALEKRIAKKRLIKQGAMQTLLTPKDDWEVKKLGEVGGTYGGLSGKSKKDFEDGNYPYIPFMNIMSNPIIDKNYVDFVNIKKGEIHNKALKGDLFFNGSSETPEEVGMCSILMNDIPNLYLNSFCFGFRFYKTTNENGLFFVYYFRSNEGRKHFRLLAQGATRYNLSKTQLLKMEIPFPPIQEQNRIATILSDMDNEIDALEKKLSKTKELKQGLMQQLLTGKIRLV